MFPIRTQRNGAFQGLYNLQEIFDGTWRDREGYDDEQFFEAETSAFDAPEPINVQFSKKSPDDDGLRADLAPSSTASGSPERPSANYLLANADLPQMINYAAVDRDRRARRLVLEELLPDARTRSTGRWSILPWDLDHTLGQRLLQRQQHVRDAGRAR